MQKRLSHVCDIYIDNKRKKIRKKFDALPMVYRKLYTIVWSRGFNKF